MTEASLVRGAVTWPVYPTATSRGSGTSATVDEPLGLAHRLPNEGATDPAADTAPGTRVGTIRCMSPEQASGEAVAAAIFSPSIVLYELAAGQHRFPGLTHAGIGHSIAAIFGRVRR